MDISTRLPRGGHKFLVLCRKDGTQSRSTLCLCYTAYLSHWRGAYRHVHCRHHPNLNLLVLRYSRYQKASSLFTDFPETIRPLRYLRYRAQFKKKSSKPFSSERANKIAYKAGLQDCWLKYIWVAATDMAKEGGRGVSGDDDDAYYRSVPWKYLCRALQNSLSNLQTAGGSDNMCPFNSSQSMDTRGSGQSSSSERYSFSEASLVGGSYGLGHGYQSSLRPRLLGRDELSFVLEFLQSCRPDRAGHRRVARSRGSDMIGECAYDNADDAISLEMFVEFCRWWKPVTNTLSLVSNEWVSVDPVKVQGFMGGEEAERLLSKKRLPGVFLLRFSKSSPERLVLTYTCKVCECFCCCCCFGIDERKRNFIALSPNSLLC